MFLCFHVHTVHCTFFFSFHLCMYVYHGFNEEKTKTLVMIIIVIDINTAFEGIYCFIVNHMNEKFCIFGQLISVFPFLLCISILSSDVAKIIFNRQNLCAIF